MLKSIVKFLKGIGNGIEELVDSISTFFSDIGYIVKLTGDFFEDLPNYFSWLPGSVVGMLVAIFGIVIIYKILGRE